MRSLVMSQSRMPSLEPSTARANRSSLSRSASSARLRSVMSQRRACHAVGPAVGVAEALAAAVDPAHLAAGRIDDAVLDAQARRQPGQVKVDRTLGAFAVVGMHRHACPPFAARRRWLGRRCRSADAVAATSTTRRSSRSRPSGPRRSRSSRSRSAPPTAAAPPRRGAARRCRPPSRPCGTAGPARRGCTARARAPSGTGRRRAARGSRLRRPGVSPARCARMRLGAQRRVVRMHAQRRDQIVRAAATRARAAGPASRAHAPIRTPCRRAGPSPRRRRPSRRRQARNAPRSRAAPLRRAGACRCRCTDPAMRSATPPASRTHRPRARTQRYWPSGWRTRYSNSYSGVLPAMFASIAASRGATSSGCTCTCACHASRGVFSGPGGSP